MNESQRIAKDELAHSKKETITSANMHLVAEIVGEYLDKGMEFSALMREGAAGLEQAAKMPGVDKEYMNQEAYAAYWIRCSIIGAFAAQQAANEFVAYFNHQFQRQPTLEETAVFLEIGSNSSRRMLEAHVLQFVANLEVPATTLNIADVDQIESRPSSEVDPPQTEQTTVNKLMEQEIKPPIINVDQPAPEEQRSETPALPPGIKERCSELDSFQLQILSLRYDRNVGLRTFAEIVEKLDDESIASKQVAGALKRALKIFARQGIGIRYLVSAETLAASTTLPYKEKKILEMCFGLSNNLPVGYAKASEHLSISTSTIKSLELKALGHIRGMFRESVDRADTPEEHLFIPSSWLNNLDSQSRQSVILRFGLDGTGLRTHAEVARESNLELRVAIQILDSALQSLRGQEIAPERLFVYPNLWQQLNDCDRCIIEKCFGLTTSRALGYDEIAEFLRVAQNDIYCDEKRIIEGLRESPNGFNPVTVEPLDYFIRKQEARHGLSS